VTPDDVVKVIDFGIAKLHGWGVKTSHQQQVGTALYMSPEQIEGKAPDPRMDVYALGLILYEALAGAHPIVTGPATMYHICDQQLHHHPRPLAEAAPGLPADLCAIADRAIAKAPERRFPTMRAMADALHEALLRRGEDRRDALLRLAASPGGRLATTQPLAPPSATPARNTSPLPSVTRAPAHLVRTIELSSSIPSMKTAEIVGPPPPAPRVARVAPTPSAPRSRLTIAAVVAAGIALGATGGVWLVLRLWPR
jgi:serine/threonine protein kinase